MEVWERVVRLKSCMCNPCDEFPLCQHAFWETDCPYCGCRAFSEMLYGPYSCEEGHVFMAIVSGWTDPNDAFGGVIDAAEEAEAEEAQRALIPWLDDTSDGL